jgi:hypothetical protein
MHMASMQDNAADVSKMMTNFTTYMFVYVVLMVTLGALAVAAAWQLALLVRRTNMVRKKFDQTRALVTGRYAAAFESMTVSSLWSEFGHGSYAKRSTTLTSDRYGPTYAPSEFGSTVRKDAWERRDRNDLSDFLNKAAACQRSHELDPSELAAARDNYDTELSYGVCTKPPASGHG